MSIKENDVGKIIIVNAGFDLSSNTELSLVFTKPDGTTVVTKTSADGVTAPATDLTVLIDTVETTLNGNEYFSYPTESGFLTPAGRWSVYGIYTDGTPKDMAGMTAEFTVNSR